jgi:ribosomal protein S18 acetylase RimI-like enzyme
MNLRLANIDDEEKIARLIAQFRVDLKQLKGIKSIPNIEQAKEEFREYIEAKYPIFVAEENNKELLGYLVCRIDNETVWAESLFVSYDARRMGIASKLYEKAEEIAKKLGGSTVYNWVHPNNDKMITFLSKKGYNVLNLIEIRKPWENEVLTKKIAVGKYEYNY